MFRHAMGTPLPARLLYLSVFLPVSSVKSSKQAKSSKLFRWCYKIWDPTNTSESSLHFGNIPGFRGLREANLTGLILDVPQGGLVLGQTWGILWLI